MDLYRFGDISVVTNQQKLIDLIQVIQDKLKVAVLEYDKLLADTPPGLYQPYFQTLKDTFEYVNLHMSTQVQVPSHLRLTQYKSIAHIIYDIFILLDKIIEKKRRAEKDEKERLKLERRFKQIRVLKKSIMETPIEDCCGICLETHLKKDTVQTSCGHCFGTVCYEKMLVLNPNKNICPMCRTETPKLTYWRLPAPRKPRCCKQPNQTSSTTTEEQQPVPTTTEAT